MTPDIVVDIGNSRMKWGKVDAGRVVEMAFLDLRHHDDWQRRLNHWSPKSPLRWAAASVVPDAMSRFIDWAKDRGDLVLVVNNADPHFPIIESLVDEPSKIGIDRLLSAVAAKSLTPQGIPSAAISVGTAMTIDWVDAQGVHVGGAILPGPRLMAMSLIEHTAKLPLVHIDPPASGRAGKNTDEAIRSGIVNAILGAADRMIRDWTSLGGLPPWVFATGGGAHFFEGFTFTAPVGAFRIEPRLTLEGIRLAAEARE